MFQAMTDFVGFSDVNMGKQSKLIMAQMQEFESNWACHKLELERISSDFPYLNKAMIQKVYDVIK